MSKRIRYHFCFILILLTIVSKQNYSQSTLEYGLEKRAIDSLETELKQVNQNKAENNSQNDLTRARISNEIGRYCLKINEYDKAIKNSRIAVLILDKLAALNNAKIKREVEVELANSNNNIGGVFSKRGNYFPAIDHFEKARRLAEAAGSNIHLAKSFENMGYCYGRLSEYVKALDVHLKALNVYENLRDKNGIARSYYNMGAIFLTQLNLPKSIEENTKALKIRDELFLADSNDIENNTARASIYNNLGNTYWAMKEFDKAMSYHQKALSIRSRLGYIEQVGFCYNNMGLVLASQKKFKEALEMHLKAKAINEQEGNTYRMMGNDINIANTYISEFPTLKVQDKNLLRSRTEKILKNALKVGFELHDKLLIDEAYDNLTALYTTLGDYDEALKNYKLFISYKDTIQSQEATKKTVQAEMKYEFDRKEVKAKLEQEKKDAIALEENRKQMIIRNSFIAGFVLMLLLAVFIFRSYRQKQKAHEIISAQKLEMEKQKNIAEQKQLQILDSINYAKRIQESILIPEADIKRQLPSTFVLYIPKDIVSGDFYWCAEVGESQMLMVVADCTGHGVPGAFLSMVASTLLNEIVNHNKISDPARVMKELAKGLSATLVSKEKENMEGMDVSICKIDRKNKSVLFAGANQSLYFVIGQDLKRIEPQVSSINGIFGISEFHVVESIEVGFKEETCVFLTTDGYSDQLGELSGKKLMNSNFEKILNKVSKLSAEEQKQILNEEFAKWKGNLKQTDDVLVIGFKI